MLPPPGKRMSLVRQSFDLVGIVQGVGFRPTLYRLAREAGLGGSAQNRSGAVRLVLEGSSETIDDFMGHLRERLPEQALLTGIEQVSFEVLECEEPGAFVILESQADSQSSVSIPVDLGICPECAVEINNRSDRHYRYAFTSCTNCGPRYTVIEDMPYDRVRTSLAPFPLCPDCEVEYTDPMNRRFHAESTCCPACGPRLEYLGEAGDPIAGDPIRLARKDIQRGNIVAVRGLGGFLLAVDACNGRAVQRLRELKRRPDKPFAVMVQDIESAAHYAHMPEGVEELLQSSRRPIVILEASKAAFEELPMQLITPDATTLGMMLPVAPLYRLLMTDPEDEKTPSFQMLIMTSGNKRGEPICIRNEEALDRLKGIADRFLVHNREVILRNDDSLCAIQLGKPQVWRRARGYAPEAIPLAKPLGQNVLAMGAHLKNTIAVGYNDQVVLSPHIGDLDTPEAVDSLANVVETLPQFLEMTPDVIAVDLHPDMHSSRLGGAYARQHGLPVVEVQHHQAHALSCMAEHALDEALALVFDGTGLGTDGRIWGAELFHVDPQSIHHLGSFSGAPLPGGDAAILRPGRQLLARWIQGGIPLTESRLKTLRLDSETANVIQQQIQQNLNTPTTTAAGRVFDAFSAWLGLAPECTTYDGQAAIRSESCARQAQGGGGSYLPEFRVVRSDGFLEIDWQPFFTQLAAIPQPGEGEQAACALGFHMRMAEAAHLMIIHARQQYMTKDVCLSGGVFMNRLLCDRLVPLLKEEGMRVHLHRKVPPNDGGIALGQVCYVARCDDSV